MEIFKEIIQVGGYAIEAMGVLIILVGSFVASGWFLLHLKKTDLAVTYNAYRIMLGRIILLGLELLLAGDIIRTVVISPTLEQVGALSVIVLIRTFLSFTLELEIEGKWPWQKIPKT